MKKGLLLVLLISAVLIFSLSAVFAAEWAPNTYYAIGAVVTYQGTTYTCIQAHTSLVGWEPPNVPALWSPGGTSATPTNTNTPSSGGATPTNTNTNTNTNTPSGGGATPTNTNTPSGGGQSPIGGSWASKVFAPYVDVMLWPTFSITNCYSKTSQKYYTLAFITANGSGDPAWGGITPITDSFYTSEISGIRSSGGNVIISCGGANGTELALHSANTNVSTLQAKYQSVINQYGLTWIDFDIEGYAVAERTSIDRRNKAIKGLQSANPNLICAFCLPVMPSGLTADGLYVLSNAKANGVRIDVVNVMAMDYGGSWDMGQAAIDAVVNTRNQCTSIGISPKMGVTPMIGMNDVTIEVFYLSDAQDLLAFCQANSYVRLLSMWSSTRDNGGCPGAQWASPTCSGISQSEFAFTNIFKAFK